MESILLDYVKFRANPEMDEKEDSFFCSLFNYPIEELKQAKSSDKEWPHKVLTLRRKEYAKQLIEVDKALFRAAKSGDHNAARLVYARFDGWTPKLAEQKIINNTVLNFADLVRRARDRG